MNSNKFLSSFSTTLSNELPNKLPNKLIEVLSPGLLSSVQDLGRRGFAHLGVSTGGAADSVALVLGNRLVGNLDSAAAIEMTITGGTFRFDEEAWVAVTGSAGEVRIDQHPISPWTTYRVRKGETLFIGSCEGARAYLCIHGGVDVPRLLGSRATDLSGGWGGFKGRGLQSGDTLMRAQDTIASPGPRRVGVQMRARYRKEARLSLRATLGPHAAMFEENIRGKFFGTSWNVAPEADRKGLRLTGSSVTASSSSEIRSEGVSYGSVQVPSSGDPIILFCEQGTTGGYPIIATIIRADWYKLGQLKPGDRFEIEEVSLGDAWRLASEWKDLCSRAVMPL